MKQKSQLMTIASMTEYETGEVTDICKKAADIAVTSYLRRPSLNDIAITGISQFINDGLYVMRKKETLAMCEGAVLFVEKNFARWFISGTGRVLYFSNGELARQSVKEPAPVLGASARFNARLEEKFEIRQGKNAFLLCNGGFVDEFGEDKIREALLQSETVDEWIEKLSQAVEGVNAFCGCATFLPEKKGFLPFLKK